MAVIGAEGWDVGSGCGGSTGCSAVVLAAAGRPGAAWHSFVRVAPFDSRYPDGFTIPTGAWLTIVTQSDGMLVLVVVDRTGVPQLTWQRPGDSWHTFERVAARDPRFPDGFTVPPGAPVSAAQPSDGTTVLVAVGNDHLPYMSWRLDQP